MRYATHHLGENVGKIYYQLFSREDGAKFLWECEPVKDGYLGRLTYTSGKYWGRDERTYTTLEGFGRSISQDEANELKAKAL